MSEMPSDWEPPTPLPPEVWDLVDIPPPPPPQILQYKGCYYETAASSAFQGSQEYATLSENITPLSGPNLGTSTNVTGVETMDQASLFASDGDNTANPQTMMGKSFPCQTPMRATEIEKQPVVMR